MTATLYLIRHASPDRTRTDLDYHTLPGPGLSIDGMAEAVNVSNLLSELGIYRVYTSPFERALLTAAFICVHLKQGGDTADALSEWGHTDTIETVHARLLPFLDEVMFESMKRGPIALVTHGWIIRTILAAWGIDADELAYYCNQFDTQNPCPCAGVWKATFGDDGYACELVYAPVPFVKYEKVTA